MAFPWDFIVDAGKALVKIIRETSAKRQPNRHWYPEHIDPIHTCYWCGRFDPLEQELTDPPCVPTRKKSDGTGPLSNAHRKVGIRS
jgi:hypothetical protein